MPKAFTAIDLAAALNVPTDNVQGPVPFSTLGLSFAVTFDNPNKDIDVVLNMLIKATHFAITHGYYLAYSSGPEHSPLIIVFKTF